ncbi:MAG TPA: PilZ domain-containing protein [Candidatus Baltobacteraceae bacterium]|nr:PilZ domain-containing protein [Candidatus Baltobacteraceae bacterium]
MSEQQPSGEREGGEKRVQGVRLRKYIDVVVEDRLSSMLFRGAIADISETGMRVIADQYLPKGTKYTFTMKSSPHLSVRGEVRWIRDFERETYQVGVLFIDVSEEDRKRLANFLDMERRRLTTPG